MDQIKKLITRKYMIAIIAIAILDTLSFSALLIAINYNKDNAYLINLSGRQRMLSQRITLQLNQLQYLDNFNNEKTILEANKDINDFEKANKILSHRHSEINKSIPEKILDFYFKENGTNAKSKYFISRSRQILEEKTTNEELIEFTTFTKGELLKNLNEAVFLFENHSNQLTRSLIIIEVFIYFLTFLNLGFILKFIFTPMRNTIVEREQELFHTVTKLKEEGKYKSTFLANMSHELRTPLNGILGVVELLHDGDLNDEQSKLINIIEDSGKNLLGTLNDILDLTRLEVNKLKIDEKNFSPSIVMKSLRDQFKPQAEMKDLTFEVENHDLPDLLYGDDHKIKQVLKNLISNALKFTAKGNIKVVSHYDSFSSHLIVKVHDTGIGIAQENQGLIFDPFKQVDTSSTRLYGGSGLGLSISKQITEAMGGTLKVNSQLSVGTTFILAIPLKKISNPSSTYRLVEEFESTYKGNILLIEANEDHRNLITRIITHYGPTIESAISLKVADRLTATRNYQLAFINTSSSGQDSIHSLENFIDKLPKSTKIYLMTSGKNIPLGPRLEGRISGIIEAPYSKSRLHKILRAHLEEDESN